MELIRDPNKLPPREVSKDLSVVVICEDWPEDISRLEASMGRLSADVELVVVDLPEPNFTPAEPDTHHLPLKNALGWAAAANLGIRQSAGRVVCLVDGSVEFTGDASPSLSNPKGLLGRWGVTTADGYEFTETSAAGRVHGVEGYLMCATRDLWLEVGLFDTKFKFYRNADIDLSFKMRSEGHPTVIDDTIPVVRHEHRAWHNTPNREELSQRNFGRFHRRWGGRPELLDL